MSEREIVSLRSKDGSCMVFGELMSESNNTWFIREAGQNCAYQREFGKTSWTIHRDLAAMPPDDFGRRCEEEEEENVGYFLYKEAGDVASVPFAIVGEKGTVLWGSKIAFLDEIPDIKITVEINGETSSLSEISEETLLKIRNKDK